MKLLTLSDVLVDLVYNPRARSRFAGVDLVIGCGDLPYYYLEYIISMLDVPLYYVRGNHAPIVEYSEAGARTGPHGGVDLHRKVLAHSGLLLAGVEGSLRYNVGPFQYTQAEMWGHVLGLAPALLANRAVYGRYLDVFATHAPPWGIHDQPDLPHQGIKAFRWLVRVFQPRYHFHGHVHVYLPMVQAIGGQGLLGDFKGLTETDLYLWIAKYQWYLRVAYRDEGEAAASLRQAKEQAARQLTGESDQPLVKRLAAVLKQAGWVDELILQQERREFLEQTCLFDVRPGANIEASVPGQYEKLLDHIAAHRWYMGEQRRAEVPYAEAVVSWYDNAYLPLARLIREQGILDQFPGRTEADLYLWIVEYRQELQAAYGGEVPLEEAAGQFAGKGERARKPRNSAKGAK